MSGLTRRSTLGLLAGSAFVSSSQAAPLKKVRILIPSKEMNEGYTPFVCPKYLGYYEQEGIDAEFLFTGGSNEAAISTSANAGDIGIASPAQSVIGMQPSGPQLDVKYFYDCVYRSIWTIAVSPDSPIKSVKDLKGKRLGVVSMGSAGITFGKTLATEAGIDPNSLAFIPVGYGAQAATSLSHNLVDGLSYSSQDAAKLEARGFPLRYIELGEGFASLPDVGLLARQEWIADEPKTLIGVGRAIAKGHIFSVVNPEAAVKINWKLYPESMPQNMPYDEALKGGLMVQQMRMKIWQTPKTDVEGAFIASDWKRMVDYLKDQGMLKQDVPLDRVYTDKFIKDINDFDKAAIEKQAREYKI